jgi:aldehyde dehydrogenase (NAD+)
LSLHDSFINNEFIEGVDKKTFDVINPSTEEVITSVSEATEKDVDLAVSAARKAFDGEWKQTPPATRGILLTKLADLMEQNAELLASIESLDNGKSISMARGDIVKAHGCIRYYGGWADKIEGKTIDVNPETFHYTRQEPVSSKITTRSLSMYEAVADLSMIYRLVFAVRSSLGTSPC